MTRLAVFVLGTMLVGCGDDAGAREDAGTDAGMVERRAYVVADLSQPVDAASAEQLGRDVDGDGTVDNQIGNIISALSQASTNEFDFQGTIDQQIARGESIVLVEILAPSFATAPAAQARVLRGEMPMPAPCDGDTDLICRQHLDGTGSFVVTAPAPDYAAGSIDAMAIDAGPSETMIPITFFGPAIWVPLVVAHVRGTISANMIATGTITGGIRATDIEAIVIPRMHAGIAAQIAADCAGSDCVVASAGAALVDMFDDNGNTTVSLEEFRANGVIVTLFRPDADIYDASGARGTDGTNDVLTLGLGFQAVLGSFPAP